MLRSKKSLTKRENEIADDTIKRYILNVLKDDLDPNDTEYKAVLQILNDLDKKTR